MSHGNGSGTLQGKMLSDVLQAAVNRLGNPRASMAPDVRRDVSIAIQALYAQAQSIQILKQNAAANQGAIHGLRQTLMVITQRLGPVDVSYDETEMLKETDGLSVSECSTPEPELKKFKRFEFVSAPADDAPVPVVPVEVEEESE